LLLAVRGDVVAKNRRSEPALGTDSELFKGDMAACLHNPGAEVLNRFGPVGPGSHQTSDDNLVVRDIGQRPLPTMPVLAVIIKVLSAVRVIERSYPLYSQNSKEPSGSDFSRKCVLEPGIG